MMLRVLVTGGAGFIGSHLVEALVKTHNVLTIDKLSYAGNLTYLSKVLELEQHKFVCADIANKDIIANLIKDFKPQIIFNLAAETHVDRSIDSDADFINTNVVGAHVLLNCALNYWRGLAKAEQQSFRFIQVSTDEVFGSIEYPGMFTEESKFAPNSPYAASKACADLLVHAYWQTYGFPAIVTHCGNNYGPRQYPEKLIPLSILKAINLQEIPLYGNGLQCRDWLHVCDHVSALQFIASHGKVGDSYVISQQNTMNNLSLLQYICKILDNLRPLDKKSYKHLIINVADRPGHDMRYALDSCKLSALGWQAKINFAHGLQQTILWYIENANLFQSQKDNKLHRQGLKHI